MATVQPACLADLNDDLLRKIASQLAESELASAVALKRCSSRFKDLAAPLVANAVSVTNEKWRDAAAKIGGRVGATITGALERNGVLTFLDVRGNNIVSETGRIKASKVEGESKEVGAQVIYQGREMVVSRGVDSDGELKLSDVTGVLAIADALKVNGVLTSLNVSSNKIGPTGATAIAEALRVNGVLKNIDLRFNSLGTEGWCAIFAALRDNKENKIEWWDLTSQDINTEIAKVLAEYVSVSGVLTNLNLGLNQIGDEGAKALASGLRVNEVMTTLNLEGSNIRAEGAAALASALRVNEVLKSIKLRGNSLGTEGWCAIFAALRDNKENKIESWDLSGQTINAEIAKVLAEYLSASEVLTTLNISSNGISPTGATVIAEALRVNGALTDLSLNSNNIGTEGAVALASALRVNGVMTDLHLSWNRIGPTGATAIADALRVNEVLKSIDLRFNHGLGDEGKGVIRDAVSGREGFKLQM